MASEWSQTSRNVHVNDGIDISRLDQAQVVWAQGNPLLHELKALLTYVLIQQLAGTVLTAMPAIACQSYNRMNPVTYNLFVSDAPAYLEVAT